MKVTAEFIFQGQSQRGGWNKKQIAALGLRFPLTQGWIGRVIDQEITDEAAREFMKWKGWLSPATKKKYRKLYRKAINELHQS